MGVQCGGTDAIVGFDYETQRKVLGVGTFDYSNYVMSYLEKTEPKIYDKYSSAVRACPKLVEIISGYVACYSGPKLTAYVIKKFSSKQFKNLKLNDDGIEDLETLADRISGEIKGTFLVPSRVTMEDVDKSLRLRMKIGKKISTFYKEHSVA